MTQAVSDLCGLLRRFTLEVVFLPETKKSKVEMNDLLPKLGDFFRLFVDARGNSAGLALLCDTKVDVELLSCSSHHIDISSQWKGEDH